MCRNSEIVLTADCWRSAKEEEIDNTDLVERKRLRRSSESELAANFSSSAVVFLSSSSYNGDRVDCDSLVRFLSRCLGSEWLILE